MRLCLCLTLAACGEPIPYTPDTASPSDAATDDGPASCTGPQSWTFSGGPEERTVLEAQWEDAGLVVEVRNETVPPRVFAVQPDGEGCVRVENAGVHLNLRGTGCAAGVVELDLTSNIGGASMQTRRGPEPTAQTSAARAGEPLTLDLAPAQPFDRLYIAALDATLCALRIEQAPLFDDPTPPDTGDE